MEERFVLVLSRKPGEKVRIGTNVTITVLEGQGNRVKIGIEAPDQLRVLRCELAQEHKKGRKRWGPKEPVHRCVAYGR